MLHGDEVYYDLEFIESGYGQPIYLLSIGMVAASGAAYYAENMHAPFHLASDWVLEHVVPQMAERIDPDHPPTYADRIASTPWRSIEEMRAEILEFVAAHVPGGRPRLYAHFADYDHVVLCTIFGRMIDLPRGWPMYTRDLQQVAESLRERYGLPRGPRCPTPQGDDEHHGLADARWNQAYHQYLVMCEAELRRRETRALLLEHGVSVSHLPEPALIQGLDDQPPA